MDFFFQVEVNNMLYMLYYKQSFNPGLLQITQLCFAVNSPQKHIKLV